MGEEMGFKICANTALAAIVLIIMGCAAEHPIAVARASSTVPAPENLPAAPSIAARDLRVMSFNLRCPTVFDGVNYWSFRKELLVQTIRGFGPDVLGTQEC